MTQHLLQGDLFDARRLLEEIRYFHSQMPFFTKEPKCWRKTSFLGSGTFLSCIWFLTKYKIHNFFTKICRYIMLQWTVITQSQVPSPNAMILKVNVYYEWHIAAPSLSIIHQESGNNMCTFNIVEVIYYLWHQVSTFIF